MRKILLTLLFVTGFMQLALAQDLIKGSVRDESGESLPGATIFIKGTTVSTAADVNGQFSIPAAKEFPFTLVVSLVGYKTQDVEVYELSDELVEVSLKIDNVLDEVVVVGYGTQKRGDLTGSVSSVSVNQLKQPISSFDRALQGAAAGVQVTSTSGQPGASVSIKIRGGNSINGSNEPLYVIDGYPVYNDNSTADAGVTNGPKINALASLNPSDIESIDILKDASATAIYGSRGANGVVIITTKKGKSGQNSVTYDGYYGLQQVIRTIPVMNAQQWALLKNDAMADSGKGPAFSQAEIDSLGQSGVGTDWQKAAFRIAPMQNHNITFSGGDERTHYALSANYFKQDGVLQNTNFERYSFRLNFDREFNDKFKIGLNLTGSKTKAQVAPDAVVPGLLQMPPTMPIYDPTSSSGFTLRSIYDNPLANPVATLYLQLNQTNTYRVFGNAYAEYKLAEGLTAKVSLGTDILINKQNRYLPSSLNEGVALNGVASVGTKFTSGWLNENTLSYTRNINDRHSFDVVVGFTQQASSTEGTITNAANFVSDATTYNNLGAGSTLQTPASSSTNWALLSYLGRINYTFNGKYHLTLTAREDGSSRLAKNNKWGFFPSAAFSWNAGRENFASQIKQISNLKIRVSVGNTGNQEIDPYSSLAQISYYSYILGNNLVSGYAPSSIANNQLGWELTTQYDGGVDLGLFDNRINVTFDAYYKRTKDLLLNVPLPYTTGQTTALENFGVVDNKGIELSLSTVNTTGAFQWTTNFVFSKNINKVISLGPGVTSVISDPSIAQVGYPLGSFIVYKTNGIFQLTDDVANLPKLYATETAGSQRYADLSGPDGVPDGVISQAYDRYIAGNAQPKFIVGLTNNFNYKNFDLNVLFQGQYGNKIYNANRASLELGTGYINASTTLLDRWTPDNPSNTVHRAIENPAVTISDRFIEDGSYLRLKNISLGYSLPQTLISKLKLKQVRVYISAQNLLTWTNYTGFDPEVSKNGQTTLTQGVDNGVYPNSKTYLGGLTISL